MQKLISVPELRFNSAIEQKIFLYFLKNPDNAYTTADITRKIHDEVLSYSTVWDALERLAGKKLLRYQKKEQKKSYFLTKMGENYLKLVVDSISLPENIPSAIENINDLVALADLGSRIIVKKDEKCRPHIYDHVVFSLLREESVIEYFFDQTTVFPGHKSFPEKGADAISLKMCEVIQDVRSKREIDIKMSFSTRNISKLQLEYPRILLNTLKEIASSLDSIKGFARIKNAIYSNEFSEDRYYILVRTKRDECFNVVLHNKKPQGHILCFSGAITVERVPINSYILLREGFIKKINSGIHLPRALEGGV